MIVLDEADKILCETIVSGSGTDHSALIQNTLLKMLDGDALYFGNEGVAQEAFSVDCSKISVVLLGAFEKLHQKKDRTNTPSIGFAVGPRDISETVPSAEISYDDLISSGMRREIAGRINRLIALEELSVSDYETILEKNLLGDLEKDGRKVVIDGAGVRQLAEEAASSGLGVRYMLSRVIRELDELVFADPKAESYKIQF
ncbi:MAG: AAA family ATPase [Firmicutes bacterium]|nr:AAA family ATPase [Bacillota bacterium]